MISPLAYIDPEAKIGKNVTVNPFAYIDKNVEIGDNCTIMPYASILSGTRMGAGNTIYQGAIIGATPQDLSDLSAGDQLRQIFAADGKKAVCYGMGDGLDAVKQAASAEYNLVVSPSALETAKTVRNTVCCRLSFGEDHAAGG